jgi:hypothetical protein
MRLVVCSLNIVQTVCMYLLRLCMCGQPVRIEAFVVRHGGAKLVRLATEQTFWKKSIELLCDASVSAGEKSTSSSFRSLQPN